MPAPRYKGLKPASASASAAARGSSRKTNTKPELILRRAVWHAGLRYRTNVVALPGKPDLVFKSARVVVFCDGDFWHGKDWLTCKQKLARGANPSYWVAKIERNIERDRHNTRSLMSNGWTVLRFWEAEILTRVDQLVAVIIDAVGSAPNRDDRAVGTSGFKHHQTCDLLSSGAVKIQHKDARRFQRKDRQ